MYYVDREQRTGYLQMIKYPYLAQDTRCCLKQYLAINPMLVLKFNIHIMCLN